MNKNIVLLLSTFLLIGFASATLTPLQEFASNSDLIITMTQNTTTNVFSINTTGLSFDNQIIQFPEGVNLAGYSTINIPISGILNGINLRANLDDGTTYPTFFDASISSTPSLEIFEEILSSEKALLNLLLNQVSELTFTGDITQDTQTLNTLAQQHPLPIPAEGNSYFIKEGTTYTLGYNKGFGAIQDQAGYKEKIRQTIEQGVNSMNLKEMLENNILPSIELDNYLSILQELGYEVEVSDEDFANAVAVVLKNTDYTGKIDLTQVSFQDGTYKIPVTIISSDGTISVQKEITLILEGIINTQTKELPTTTDTYTPSDDSIKEIIEAIVGLQLGTIVEKIEISDIKPTAVAVLNNANELKYLIIEVDQQPLANANISFKIEKSKVDHLNKISLYVWETATSTWTKLATTFVGDTGTEYEYNAVTPHFSTFMIAEDTTTSSSSSSHQSSASTWSDSGSSVPATITEPTPIALNDSDKTSDNFFTRLGRFLTGAVTGIGDTVSENPVIGVASLLTFLIAVFGVLVLVKLKR